MAENYNLSMDNGAFGFTDAPSACQEALAALASPHATTEEIGQIISRDKTLTARLLQATNSVRFGLARKITDAAEAVNLLGFQTVTGILADLERLSPSRQPKARVFLPPHASNAGGHAGATSGPTPAP
jgi:HD-like signal output (HDOD) protein